MNEEIHEGLMKEGSLSAKIYFLLLDKPKTQTEISKIIYSGKIQLANIKKNIEDLEEEGFVEIVGRNAGIGKNFNRIYYQSTLKPIMNFIEFQVGYRKDTSKSKQKELLTDDDRKFLEIFLVSKWFKRFYSQEYLNVDLECEGKRDKRICSCPIRFLARLLEEIFVINESFGKFKMNYNNLINLNEFDNSILEAFKKINEADKKRIKRVLNYAKKTLGNYPETDKTLEMYFDKLGVLMLPFDTSKKLSTLGRIPLTIQLHFIDSLKKEYL
jgi:predicted transcriptional regulator